MGVLIYAGLVLALTLVLAAGILGGVTWNKAVNGTASSVELAGRFGVTVGIVVIAGAVAFVTSAVASVLAQFI